MRLAKRKFTSLSYNVRVAEHELSAFMKKGYIVVSGSGFAGEPWNYTLKRIIAL